MKRFEVALRFVLFIQIANLSFFQAVIVRAEDDSVNSQTRDCAVDSPCFVEDPGKSRGEGKEAYKQRSRGQLLVIPGEEVTTGEGRKSKIWTTQGPVPVSPAPEPFENKGAIGGEVDVNIEVDTGQHR